MVHANEDVVLFPMHSQSFFLTMTSHCSELAESSCKRVINQAYGTFRKACSYADPEAIHVTQANHTFLLNSVGHEGRLYLDALVL